MKKPISFGSISFELVSSLEETKGRTEPDTPFALCILGDFTGRASRNIVEPVGGRKAIPVDRDIIDEVMEKMKVKLRLASAGSTLDIAFSSLDDFHPDHILNRIGIFRALKDVRKKLGDPRTFNTAVKVLKELTGASGTKAGPGTDREKPVPRGGSLLDEMIGQAVSGTDKSPVAGNDLDAFVQAVVRPHLVAGEDPEQARLTAALDQSISDLMAEVMHHRHFQALESAWRGVQFLVSRMETDENLQIFLLDISAEELAEDLFSNDDLARTGIYRLLTEGPRSSAGTTVFSVLAGNYSFDHSDAALLGRMAKIASAAHAPFIAQADPCLVGCSTLSGTPDPATWRTFPDRESLAAWDNLRHLPEAAYLGLVMPRFLLRLPFGRDTDAAETFDFEEMVGGSVHEHYLWGNPALACAYLLARAFSLNGWDMHVGAAKDVDNLPLHVYSEQGSSTIKPCAEVLLTEKAADAIMDAGIMPFATLKDTDTARLIRFQSLAEPPTSLAGRWNAR
jgi:type VI secretion system protein ImpC